MSIYTNDYTILDIYSDSVKDLFGSDELIEKVKMFKMINRIIEKKNVFLSYPDKYYYRDFYFEIDENEVKAKKIEITVNTDILGLEICVQKYSKVFD